MAFVFQQRIHEGIVGGKCRLNDPHRIIRLAGEEHQSVWNVSMLLKAAGRGYGEGKRHRQHGQTRETAQKSFHKFTSEIMQRQGPLKAPQSFIPVRPDMANTLHPAEKYSRGNLAFPGSILKTGMALSGSGTALQEADKIRLHKPANPSKFKVSHA
jgi:hypothetical protein